MEKAVYINSVSTYLPNSPIANEDMEDYIGKIGGNPSRVRSIVLRQNGIKTRYYGLDKKQNLTHSNAELAKEAVCGLFENGTIPDDLTLLACGTSTPDQLLPSHASMVHGELANFPMEILLCRCMPYLITGTENMLQQYPCRFASKSRMRGIRINLTCIGIQIL